MTKALPLTSFLSVLIWCGQLMAQSPGQTDVGFNPTDAGFGINDGIRTANGVNDQELFHAVLMPDGRTVMGGLFDQHENLAQKYVTRLMPDGSMDPTFDPDVMNSYVEAVAVQPDNKVIVGGRFETIGGISRNSIARLNQDGSLDTTFQVGYGFQGALSNYVDRIVLQPDGKVICTGIWTMFDSLSIARIVRLNANGSLDATFVTGTGFNSSVKGMALQPDGKLLAAGWFWQYNGVARPGIARLNANGSLDNSFNPTFTGGSQHSAMHLRTDGKIWLSGLFSAVNGIPRDDFVLLTATGATDPSFDPTPNSGLFVNTIAGQADGKLLVGLHMNSPLGDQQNFLFRFNADGTLDPQLAGVDFNSIINHVLLLPDQRIMAFGRFHSLGDRGESSFTRLMPDGTVDPTFAQANALDHYATRIIQQSDGKLIIAGSFYAYFDRTANRVVRIEPNGAVDTTFDAWWGISGLVNDVAFSSAGKIVIGGHFSSSGSPAYSRYVMRLNSDGSRDTTFQAVNNIATCRRLAVQSDDKVVVAVGNGVHRRLANGDVDTTFTSGGSNASITDLMYLSNGDILVAHHGSTWNGTPVGRVFRLNPDGTIDNGFSNGTGMGNGSVNSMVRQPNGSLIFTGSFTTYDGNTAPGIVRVTSNGSFDPTFTPGTGLDDDGELVRLGPNGMIYVSGDFTNVNGTAKAGFARLNADGTLDNSFDPGTGPNNGILEMLIDPQGDAYIVGRFTSYDGIGRNRVAKVYASPSTAVQEFDTDEPFVSPNPNNGEFSITTASWEPGMLVELIDAEGRLVNSFPLTGPATRMNVSAQPGAYAINIRNKAGIMRTQRVIIH